MAGTIKGITIEINGDTTKLSSALRQADSAIKETQSQLNAVEKSLKFDPGNIDLLRDKFRLMGDRISETKDRLATLEEAQRQMDAAGVDKNSDEYRALQTEIDTTKSKIKGLEKQMDDFGSVGVQKVAAVGSKLQEVGSGITKVGEGLTKYVTGPIVAIGAASVAAFAEVDKGYDVMIQKTGATGEAAQELQGIMENIASTIPTDFETAGAAIGEVSTRFGVTGDELETLSTQFIQFAKLNSTDVSGSIDQVQKALSAYGLSVDNAAGFLDRLNKVGQDTGVSVDKLASGIVSNGTAFQEMGLSIDEAVTFMGQLEKSGANSETVLNGMRKALKNAAQEGKPLDQALAELQDTIINGTNGMDGLTAAYELFGKSGDQIYGAVKNGTLDFKELSMAMEDASGSVSETFNETLDPMTQWQTVLNELKIVGAELGATLGEILVPVIQKIGEWLKVLKEKWDALSPGTQEMIVKVGMIVAAIGPLLVVIGNVISIIGTIMTVLPALMAVLSGPIGIIALIVAAVVALGVIIYKNWDEIKAWAKGLVEEVKQMVTNFVNKINELKQNVQNKIEEMKTAVITKITNLKDDAINKVKEMVTNMVNKILELKNNVQSKIEEMKTAVVTKITSLKTDATNKFEDIKNGIKEKVDNAKQAAVDAFENMKKGITDRVSNIKDSIQNGFEGAVEYITSLPGKAFQWGADIIEGIVDGIKSMIGRVADAASEIAGKISEYIHFSVPDRGPLHDFRSYMPDMINEMVRGINAGIPKIENAMSNMASAMMPGALQNGNTVNNANNITMTIYGAQGQNVNQLAEVIQRRINQQVYQNEAVFA